MRRMYTDEEDVFYYISVHNENYPMPSMPENSREGILKGLYKFKKSVASHKLKAQILGSGAIIHSALKAAEILEKDYGVSVDVWSATNYKRLRTDTLNAERWNRLHPSAQPKRSYLQEVLEKEEGVFVAVSDNMKIVPDQIAPWVPGGLVTLGTDGFGRSDTRQNLRRFFEVDAESTVIATLGALAKKGKIDIKVVDQAIKDLKVDPEKIYPVLV